MRLGLVLGYGGNDCPADLVGLAQEAERLGYDSVWTSDSRGPSCWGWDAFTTSAWIAAHTSRIQLGTAVAHMAARSPTVTAMQTLLLDHLCDGRFILGLSLSRPHAVEGWYGRPFPKSPLTATREYLTLIRQVLAQGEPVALTGEYYTLPYTGPDATGEGRPLRSVVNPIRTTSPPIFLGALGLKNVAQTVRIADGWLPMHWSPFRPVACSQALTNAPENFRTAPLVHAHVCRDTHEGIASIKEVLTGYIGGMGVKEHNFHADRMAWMGFEAEARRIQELFSDGRHSEAIAVMPDAFVDETSLVGPKERIAERLAAWKESRITDLLLITRDSATIRILAELVV